MDIKEIRDNLSQFTIPKDKIESKGGSFGDYIKWSYALGIILSHYPTFRYEFTQWEQADGTLLDVQYYKDGSCSVEVTCWIDDIRQHMWLPVTKPTGNEPSTNCFDINTAKMRCLTKCISVGFGLGADIYGMDMLQEFKTEKVEGSKRISNSPSNGVTNPSLPKDSEPSPVIAEPDELPRLRGADEIPVGYNKGETYAGSYGDDLTKVRKDIKHWKPRTNLKDNQQLHLNTLIALEKHIIKKQEKAFKS